MGEIEYTIEDAEDFIISIVINTLVLSGMDAPVEKYRRALLDGKSVLEALYTYLRVTQEDISKRISVQDKAISMEIKRVLSCPWKSVPLYINSDIGFTHGPHLMKSAVYVREIAAWRLGLGK